MHRNFGISRSYVSRIEKNALSKLRSCFREKGKTGIRGKADDKKKACYTLCEGGKERDLSYENKRKNGKSAARHKIQSNMAKEYSFTASEKNIR